MTLVRARACARRAWGFAASGKNFWALAAKPGAPFCVDAGVLGPGHSGYRQSGRSRSNPQGEVQPACAGILIVAIAPSAAGRTALSEPLFTSIANVRRCLFPPYCVSEK